MGRGSGPSLGGAVPRGQLDSVAAHLCVCRPVSSCKCVMTTSTHERPAGRAISEPPERPVRSTLPPGPWSSSALHLMLDVPRRIRSPSRWPVPTLARNAASSALGRENPTPLQVFTERRILVSGERLAPGDSPLWSPALLWRGGVPAMVPLVYSTDGDTGCRNMKKLELLPCVTERKKKMKMK